MKKIVGLCFAALLLFFTSCGSKNEVAKVVDLIDEAAAAIDKTSTSSEAVTEIGTQQSEIVPRIMEIIDSNANLELTDTDKSKLRDAMRRYVEVNIKKSGEAIGEKPESLEATANSLLEQTIYPAIDQAKTLGDLGQAVVM